MKGNDIFPEDIVIEGARFQNNTVRFDSKAFEQ